MMKAIVKPENRSPKTERKAKAELRRTDVAATRIFPFRPGVCISGFGFQSRCLFGLLLLLLLAVNGPALTLDEALAQLPTYDEGKNNAALVVIEREVGRLSANPTQRQVLAARLAALLEQPGVSAATKLFVCQQLRLIGGPEQVPVLARLLGDPKTADMARISLQAMPEETVSQALLNSLSQIEGNALIGVINTLGDRQDAGAVNAIAALLTHPNARVAGAAAHALGKMGSVEAARSLLALKPSPSLAPALRDAQLQCAQRLVAAGQANVAEPIYRQYLSAGQPLNVRVAALAGLTSAAGDQALPQLVEALNSGNDPLPNLAIELIRRFDTPPARAVLRKALAKADASRRLLLLGALAEHGDNAALTELIKLSRNTDKETRKTSAAEVRRLSWATCDPIVQKRLGELAGEPEPTVEPLTPAPYSEKAIAQRRKDIAANLASGDKLVAYLDCGAEVIAERDGARIRQMNGAPWVYAGSEKAAAPTFGTVAFEGSRLEFEISGLDPKQHYALGFSWWDYDNNGRVQSIQWVGGQPAKRLEVLPKTKLPAFARAKQGPATGQLPMDPALMAKGKLRIAFLKHAGPNAVVSELWLIATPAGSPTATQVVRPAAAPTTVATVAKKMATAKPVMTDLTPPASGTRVLLVTGIDYPGHHWKETAPVLKRLLEKDPRLKVRIVEDPNALASPKLKDWDVVIIHWMNWETKGPGQAARENLKQFVAGGKGMLLTHFACGAWYGEWPDFAKLAGRVWFGPKGGRQHDPRGKFTVEIADPQHPIMRGLEPFETTDELYTCLEGDTPIHVVAKARSKVDQKYYPMAFVLNYGKGRVFQCVLGHDVLAYTNNPGVGQLLRRACAWAAGQAPVPTQ